MLRNVVQIMRLSWKSVACAARAFDLGWVCVLLLPWLAGCGQDKVRVYNVPKENEAPPSAASPSPSAASANPHAPMAPQLTWTKPNGWEEQARSGMRVAQFTVPGQNDQKAEVAVIAMGGVSASREDLVNMWRAQVKLAPASAEELSKLAESVKIGEVQGDLYDMVSTEPVTGHGQKARILVAMLKQDATSWFFKMTGPESLVQEQKTVFQEFLKSISFASRGAEAAPAAAAATPAGPPAASPPPARSKPQWTVPAPWKEEPPTSLGLARFVVDDASLGHGEVTVTVIPGDGGGKLANVNRWRRQVTLEPISDAELKQTAAALAGAGAEAFLVDMTGATSKQGKESPTRMLAAVVPQGSQTWFYKFTGDPGVVGREKDAFVKFVESVKYSHAD